MISSSVYKDVRGTRKGSMSPKDYARNRTTRGALVQESRTRLLLWRSLSRGSTIKASSATSYEARPNLFRGPPSWSFGKHSTQRRNRRLQLLGSGGL